MYARSLKEQLIEIEIAISTFSFEKEKSKYEINNVFFTCLFPLSYKKKDPRFFSFSLSLAPILFALSFAR